MPGARAIFGPARVEPVGARCSVALRRGQAIAAPRTRRSHSARGFTLIEVLIASAILGTAFVAVVGLMSGSLRNIARINAHEQLLLHAREQMTELLLEQPLVPGEFSGRWTDGYRWQASITPAAGEQDKGPGGYGLYDVRLRISWSEGRNRNSYVVETKQWARSQPAPATP